MLTAFLLPLNSGLVVDGATVTATEFTLQVTTAAPTAYCPLCHHASSQVHSRYSRTLHDLAIAGHQVRLQLTTRRFFCRVPTCPRRIFTERLPLLTRPYAHRTLRQRDTLHRVALTAGGESGARLAAVLALPASPATLLRLIRQLPPPPAPTPRVLGVDDWAKRKGYTYGTILCDLETGRVVDLLADREATTFAAWLHAHPGIEIISRDRAGAYAEGARLGAPTARQVADRFHVLVNLGSALEDLLRRLYPQLQAAFAAADSNNPPTQEPIQPSGEPDSPPAPPQGAARPRRAQLRAIAQRQTRRQARLERYEEMRRLIALGWSQRAIGEKLDLTSKTIRRWLHHDQFPERQPPPTRRSPLDAYKPYLQTRWAEGCQNAQLLWRELRERDYRGGRTSVREYVRPWRTAQGPSKAKPAQLSSPRHLKWLLLKPVAELDSAAYTTVRRICQQSTDVTVAYGLVTDFQDLVRRRQAGELADWVARTLRSGIAELVSFAHGVQADFAAVLAGFEVEWSQGPVEGQVNRLKLVKRSMYGRAKFDLLRLRVLHAP